MSATMNPTCLDCGATLPLTRPSPRCSACAHARREALRRASRKMVEVPCRVCRTMVWSRLGKPRTCAGCFTAVRRRARVQQAASPTPAPYITDYPRHVIERRFAAALRAIRARRGESLIDERAGGLIRSSLAADGVFFRN